MAYTPKPGCNADLVLQAFKAPLTLQQLVDKTGLSEEQVRNGIDHLCHNGIEIKTMGQGSKSWRLVR